MVFKKSLVFITLSFLFYFSTIVFSYAQSNIQNRRAELEGELAQIEKEIQEQRVYLESKQKERVSLERDVAILDSKIEKSQLDIRKTDLNIEKLSKDIGGKQKTITELNSKVVREKKSLAQILRRTNEIDDFSLVEVVLDNKNISDFFEDIDSFDSVKVALQESFVEIEGVKNYTEAEKKSLEAKRAEEQELRQIQLLQKKRIEEQKAERKNILDLTKGQEAVYQKIISDKEKTANQIRSELFAFRDTAAIPFEKALDLAEQAEKRTGVRAAFILGILAEESNLGENVGTGDWITDMHPNRDKPVFEVITKTLGLNPYSVPVSKKPWYGWGGAMGPAQFIPSTWACFAGYVNSLTGSCKWGSNYTGTWIYDESKDRIRKLVGKGRPSNPWEPEDAIMAAADLLDDNGASKGTYAAERLAALRYLAGWANATKPAYAFYGDDVMELASYYQKQIDILKNS
jgi:peptidoglycan hydrolase CwlO-like protein